VATLSADFELPLRSFELRLALEVERTVALVGPSGAGKSSVLRAIAGLARPSGRIALDDEVWLDADVCRPPEERRVGLVFQEYALFPHLNVERNVAFGGKERVAELLERFRISHLAQARPRELSGGERQRVALARALARDPGVLLLDEPLSALDAHTKDAVRLELQELLQSFGLPTLIVTHDYEDAAALAGTVGVLVEGELRQLGSPAELVSQPSDPFVASFTGANLLHGRVQSLDDGLTRVRLETGEVIYSTDTAQGDVGVVVYPWDVAIGRIHADDSALNLIHGEIASVSRVGNRVRVKIGPLTAGPKRPRSGSSSPAAAPSSLRSRRRGPGSCRSSSWTAGAHWFADGQGSGPSSGSLSSPPRRPAEIVAHGVPGYRARAERRAVRRVCQGQEPADRRALRAGSLDRDEGRLALEGNAADGLRGRRGGPVALTLSADNRRLVLVPAAGRLAADPDRGPPPGSPGSAGRGWRSTARPSFIGYTLAVPELQHPADARDLERRAASTGADHRRGLSKSTRHRLPSRC
jgi:ABC-type sulfate/molybdate transport systems ATPase subunit